MKKIQSKRHFIIGLITTILAAVCITIAILNVQNLRFIISAVLLLIFAGVNYTYAFSKKDFITEMTNLTDERDQYITMKSCQSMVIIVNYTLLGVCLCCLILSGAFKTTAFLTVAITLCGVLILMFLTTLFANSYYEKRE